MGSSLFSPLILLTQRSSVYSSEGMNSPPSRCHCQHRYHHSIRGKKWRPIFVLPFMIVITSLLLLDGVSACSNSLRQFNGLPRRANYNTYHQQGRNNSRRQTATPLTPSVGDLIISDSFGNFRMFKNAISPARPSKCGHSRYYKHAADHRQASIVGGLVALPNEFPWIVRLQIINPNTNASQLCSGSILSEHFLITAAHCILDVINSPQAIIAVIGEHDMSQAVGFVSNKWAVAVSQIYIHPNYSSATNEHDAAILRVERNLLRPVDGDNRVITQSICLPSSCDDGCGESTGATIAGWGATIESDLKASKVLQKAHVPIASNVACASAFANLGQTITDDMICAGYPVSGGVDTCYGDSGGPLMTAHNGYFQMCGITSFGDGCGKPGLFGVYTRVCTMLEWLQETIKTDVPNV